MDPRLLKLPMEGSPSNPWPKPAAPAPLWPVVVIFSITVAGLLGYIAQAAFGGPPSIWWLILTAALWVFVCFGSRPEDRPAVIGVCVFVLAAMAGCFYLVRSSAALNLLRGKGPALAYAAAGLVLLVAIVSWTRRRRSTDTNKTEPERTAAIRDNVRELVLAAQAHQNRFEGRTPEEDGRTNPRRYLEPSGRTEEIEQTYLHKRNGIGTPAKRWAIAAFILEHMPGDLDIAQTPEKIETLLKFYWEADHRALTIAREVSVPPDPDDAVQLTIEENIIIELEQIDRVEQIRLDRRAAIDAATEHLSEPARTMKRRERYRTVDAAIAAVVRRGSSVEST